MRNVLLFAVLLGVAACGPLPHWEKPGADQAALVQDSTQCRRAAQQEAFRYYTTPYPNWALGYGRVWRWSGGYFWQSSFDSDRDFTENRLAAFCMRSRGYELVSTEPRQTQAPQQPGVPEPAKDK
jgi:hypothetical protein